MVFTNAGLEPERRLRSFVVIVQVTVSFTKVSKSATVMTSAVTPVATFVFIVLFPLLLAVPVIVMREASVKPSVMNDPDARVMVFAAALKVSEMEPVVAMLPVVWY